MGSSIYERLDLPEKMELGPKDELCQQLLPSANGENDEMKFYMKPQVTTNLENLWQLNLKTFWNPRCATREAMH